MKALLALPFMLFACGDNLAGYANSGSPDAHQAGSADAGPQPIRALAAEPPANFGPPPGILSLLEVDTLTMHQNVEGGLAGGDPFIKKLGDRVYIVNRTDNNVLALDARTLQFVGQLGTGPGSNPQDVAVVGAKLYVPAFGTAGVVVGTLGGSDLKTIDLNAAVASTDGKPDCVGVAAVGTDVYVTCENLVSFAPATVGKLVVIDSTTDTVKTHIDLPVQNPQNLIAELPDHTLVVSSYDKAAGCTIQITPGATPTATCLVGNTQLATGGAEPTHIAVQGGKIWFASTTDYTDGGLRSYDTATSMMGELVAPSTENIRDIAVCPNGKLVVADTAGTGGLRVYQDGAELTTAALPIGLPPGFGNNLICY
ncbi:MAG: hypothetical protein ABJE66_09185 [Deltaproteobacteria bacterium]